VPGHFGAECGRAGPANGALKNEEGRRGAGLLRLLPDVRKNYVVGRGLMAMAVAGTTVPLPENVQPASVPGVQAGRLGLICSVSVSEETLM
jgi:hypothetical protein